MKSKTAIKKSHLILILALFLSGGFAFFTRPVLASTTDGIIDPTYTYAWGENIGWINFGTGNGNVHVTDAGLSGYALSETVGWINVSAVANDGQGNLSGYAWGENVGYVKFNPTNGGVVINSSGVFTGSALSETVGWIVFGGGNAVTTDWRPRSARPACNNALDDDTDGNIDFPADPGCSSLTDTSETDAIALAPGGGGGGGGLPPGAYNPPIAPENGFGISINGGATETDSRGAVLTLTGGLDTRTVRISESPQFPEGFQMSYDSSLSQISVSFTLSEGAGAKTVYIRFCTQWGSCSEVVSDGIVVTQAIPVQPPAPEVQSPPVSEKPRSALPEAAPFEAPITNVIEKIKKVPGRIIEGIKQTPEILAPFVPEFLKPSTPEVALPLVEEVVPKETPLAFLGAWQLLPREPIREFVLAPLPASIRNLVQKFPTLKKTFEETGIAKMTDVAKLNSVALTLPGLTERVGMPTVDVEPGKPALPKGVPIVSLTPLMKQQMPTEIVFAKAGGGLLDFNPALSVTDQGEPQQKIETISGKTLQLSVKPDSPVTSVKGYVVFTSKRSPATSLEFPSDTLLASVFFANPVFAATQEVPVRVEEKLVLQEFDYLDSDGDGIYTAEIQVPVVDGEYEIITVLNFTDPDLGAKEIRLTTVVEPEGYLYEKAGDKEIRVPGAIVTLYGLNPATKQYEIWPAKDYQQENPQTTDVRGTYSFLVPEGDYYLDIEAPGYLPYEGKPFQVKEGSGIHANIELKTRFWWLAIVDWKTILLVAVALLLLYNFYRDKMREKVKPKNMKSPI
ncbi:hypothetical protein KJ925_04445 [Patescibacteria group bacterium]|nr:hypothetical protein [Patescibacteria group bacterium]